MSSIFYCTNLLEYQDPEKKRATGATILPAFYIEHSANCDGWSISFFNTWKMANGSLNGFYNFQFSLLHKVYDQFEFKAPITPACEHGWVCWAVQINRMCSKCYRRASYTFDLLKSHYMLRCVSFHSFHLVGAFHGEPLISATPFKPLVAES